MTHKGAVILTEAALQIVTAAAPPILVVDLWDDFVPDFGALDVIKVEPRRWWLLQNNVAPAALATQIADHGTLTPIGGGLKRTSLNGDGWRALLMNGGWFDAENPAFAVGHCVGTLIGHVSVRLHVVSATQCDVYFASSYQMAMEHHWRHALGATP